MYKVGKYKVNTSNNHNEKDRDEQVELTTYKGNTSSVDK
jgi:hypothetical protein